MKPVTYYTPEFLSYYAVEDCVAKCRAYIEENGSYIQTDLELGTLSHGKVWTMPMQYGVIAGKLGKMPSYYDVWVEDAAGTRLTYIQRYYASDIRSEEEQWVLFENSLGGIDTFRAYGDAENTAKHTHNVAEIENDSEEYRVDTVREYKKNTGFLSKEERKWLLDFFPSLGKFLYIGNYVRRIVVTESDVSWQTKDLPSSYTFTYKYADARPYLNITRSEDAAPAMLDIKIPDVGSFTIAPRLVELERLPLSSGALFPVQSPYSDKWNITTAAAILEWFSREVTTAYKGDGAFGHRHDNMSVLNALDRIGDYLTLDAQKIAAGLADEAKAARTLDPKSTDWEKIVRTDQDTIVNALTTFMKGIVFGKSVRGESGVSIYQDEQGAWHVDAEYLHVHRKLTAEEVEIMKTSHIKGKIVNSAGSFVISKIERIVGAWRCYFRQQDSEGRRVYNSMRVDDLALCETFNLIDAGGQLSNHYWHRRVIAVGTDYVDIADNTNVDDYASGSDTPQVGDEVVQLGNLTYEDRQSAIIQSAAGEDAPYFKIIKGINSFTLPDPIFLFDKDNFDIRVEDPAKRGEYIRLQAFLDTMQGRISAVQQQADKQLVIWFGDAIPSMTSEPANEWADDATKELHVHDIYYNRSYAQTGGGRAYSFEKNADNTYSWHEITDADVLKSLEAAKHAQDTADGKRRVFVRDQPVPPYDEGDQWSNATYKEEYNNDLLVCIRPKAAGEEFSIEDWQSAQALTSAQFKSEIKTATDNISATVTSLKNGLVEVGFELDGKKKTFTVTAENFKVKTPKGDIALMTRDGKVNAELIEAKEVRTTPGDSGLHIEMYEGIFDIFTKDNKKGISMNVDKDGFPHLIFFDTEGNAKYDLGYTGFKELVSAYQAAYWTKNSLVNVTDKGLSAVYPKTVKGIVWHEYHAARHYATGKLGDNAEDDGKLFSTESFGSPIPNGWYTAENEQGQYLEGGNESVVDEDNHNTPKSSVFSVAIFKAENGRLGEAMHVWFCVTNGRASFCDPDGKPIIVTESILQNYPFDQYKDRV